MRQRLQLSNVHALIELLCGAGVVSLARDGGGDDCYGKLFVKAEQEGSRPMPGHEDRKVRRRPGRAER
jgi:hypothetical protein